MPRHVPPSRIRYEKKNPKVSVRLTASLRKTLDGMRKEEGLSYADLVKRGLIATAATEATHQQGRIEVKAACVVKVPCAVCGKPVVIKPNKATIDYLMAKGWTHRACVKRSD